MNVLLLEDDRQLNTTITNFLVFSGYEVRSLKDGDEALEEIDQKEYELFIIDINVPSISGLELLKYIRQKNLLTPIIIITASLELKNFKTAFEDGCDEYIKKPFYLEELEIRINRLLQKNDNEQLIHISNSVIYDISKEELKVDGSIIRLRKKERRFLTILLKNPNKTVSTEMIENYVWENEIKSSYPIRQLATNLRKKLQHGREHIVSDKGLGYRFEAKK
jgi:DNA-binding response OmpR family regulator